MGNADQVGVNKLELTQPPRDLVQFEVAGGANTLLPIELSHIDELSRRPSIHRDSFYRMLVAQARHEGLTLVS